MQNKVKPQKVKAVGSEAGESGQEGAVRRALCRISQGLNIQQMEFSNIIIL